MGISQAYRVEIEQFDHNFSQYKDKKIVLYGIGRYTATLVSANLQYQFVGLMDRDQEQIGKEIYGLPIVGAMQAEQMADMIVINTVEAYWETIYNRISDLKIPIFFRNGKQAQISATSKEYENLEYWNRNEKELREKIQNSEIVSFDLFDTLVMRKVLAPYDIFWLVAKELSREKIFDGNYVEYRQKASIQAGSTASLEEIYACFCRLTGISSAFAKRIQEIELHIELQHIVPRNKMIACLNYALELEKQVYILSDMYVSKAFVLQILKNLGMDFEPEHIWISCEKKSCKADGTMWKQYQEEVVKNKKALHIGDNQKADMEQSEKAGIEAFYVMRGVELLRNSSIARLEAMARSAEESRVIGMLVYELFQNPFALSAARGKVTIEDAQCFGYIVYGSVIYSFLTWLVEEMRKDSVKRIFFMARDGYFLYQDYKWYMQFEKQDEAVPAEYFYISRRAVIVASICDEESFQEAVCFPYTGTFADYMLNRFNIRVVREDSHKEETINAAADYDKLVAWMGNYEKELKKEITYERNNFLNYINRIISKDQAAVIDLWYYGNTQYFLNKMLERKVCGYYFATDLSPDNRFMKFSKMKACFQEEDDLKAERSSLRKKALITESFLTAPHGMVKYFNENAEPVYDKENQNQQYFAQKIKINEGIKTFIRDYKLLLGAEKGISPAFADHLFGVLMQSSEILGKDLQESFWIDNNVVQQREFKIFE